MPRSQPTTVLWFRDDLRLADNPALTAARDDRLHCLYVFDMESHGLRRLGAASRWWLHGALAALDADLRKRGQRLTLLRGAAGTVVPLFAKAVGADRLVFNRRYGSAAERVDETIVSALQGAEIGVESFNAALLAEPWEVKTRAGTPMKVFSVFWRALEARGEPDGPLARPRRLPAAPDLPRGTSSLALADLDLLPTEPDWAGGLRDAWSPGETGAHARLRTFVDEGLADYAAGRDFPDRPVTSRLSPSLRFGEVSPRQVWHAAEAALHAGRHGSGPQRRDMSKLASELGWREFAYQQLWSHPNLATENVQKRFDAFPWRTDRKGLRAWQQGRTGYPIVDAGMRQLWATGWMHNRVRLIVGSFLTKHLLIDWRQGEQWFWDTLVDADPANNTTNWQWVAGCGVDAAPYFRIFNPVLQGRKFDPDGGYVRTWVPELTPLADRVIHAPWTAQPNDLEAAGIVLGKTYPKPIVDHDMARKRALAAFKGLPRSAKRD